MLVLKIIAGILQGCGYAALLRFGQRHPRVLQAVKNTLEEKIRKIIHITLKIKKPIFAS